MRELRPPHGEVNSQWVGGNLKNMKEHNQAIVDAVGVTLIMGYLLLDMDENEADEE